MSSPTGTVADALVQRAAPVPPMMGARVVVQGRVLGGPSRRRSITVAEKRECLESYEEACKEHCCSSPGGPP